MPEVAVVIPTWNGREDLADCLGALQKQSFKPHIIVVDNGSIDGTAELIETGYLEAELIKHTKNLGFAGGVNAGFRRAIELGFDYAAALNNDAVADEDWLKNLERCLRMHEEVGIATSKILTADGNRLDSTGDFYTVWGLPYPRGRDESRLDKYDHQIEVFGASGGASLYRVKMLEQIGLFDEDFFAYYEDVDLSFRAQLAGWKIRFVPSAVVHHQIGATSSKLRGFTTYQTMKNLQLLWYKNVPRPYLFKVGWRFTLASSLFLLRAFTRGQGWAALKGDLKGAWLLLKKHPERRQIQKSRTASNDYIWGLIIHDLPPDARVLRRLRRMVHWRRGTA